MAFSRSQNDASIEVGSRSPMTLLRRSLLKRALRIRNAFLRVSTRTVSFRRTRRRVAVHEYVYSVLSHDYDNDSEATYQGSFGLPRSESIEQLESEFPGSILYNHESLPLRRFRPDSQDIDNFVTNFNETFDLFEMHDPYYGRDLEPFYDGAFFDRSQAILDRSFGSDSVDSDLTMEQTSGFSDIFSTVFPSIMGKDCQYKIFGMPADIFLGYLTALTTNPTIIGKVSTLYLYLSASRLYFGYQETQLLLTKMQTAFMDYIRCAHDKTVAKEAEYHWWRQSRGMSFDANLSKINEYYSYLEQMHYGNNNTLEPTSFTLDSPLDFIDKFIESPEEFVKSLVGYHTRRVAAFLIFYGIVPDTVVPYAKFFNLYDEEISSGLKDPNMFVITGLIKSVSFMLRKVFGSDKGWSPSRDPHSFILNVQWLYNYRYKQCNPDELHMHCDFVSSLVWKERCEKTYQSRLYLGRGESDNTSCLRLLVQHSMRDIAHLYDNFINASSAPRDPPFVVGLAGDSGSGKTTFLAPLFSQIILQEFGYECHNASEHFQILNGNDQYLASYRPNEHHSVLFDELGAYKNADRNTNNIVANSFLEFCSSGKFILNSAHLEEKGKREFRPRAIFIASNKQDFGLPELVNHLPAAWNRFHIVLDVKIKHEYTNYDGALPVGGINLDFLHARRAELRAELGDRAKFHPDFYPVSFGVRTKGMNGFNDPKSYISFQEVIEYIRDSARKHKQTVINHQNNTFSNVTDIKCTACGKYACSCFEQTSGSLVAPSFFLYFCTYLMYLLTTALVLLIQFLGINNKYTRRVQVAHYRAILEKQYLKVLTSIAKQKLSLKQAIGKYLYTSLRTEALHSNFHVVAILAALTGSYLLARYLTGGEKTESIIETSGKALPRSDLPPNQPRVPSKVVSSTNNIWGNSNVSKTIYGKACASPKELLISKIWSNTKLIMNTSNGEYVHIINVHSCYHLCVRHFVDKLGSSTFDVLEPIADEEGEIYREKILTLSLKNIHVINIGDDSCLLYLPSLRAGPSLLKYFLEDKGSMQSVNATYFSYDPNDYSAIEVGFEGNFSNFNVTIGNDVYSRRGIVGRSTFPSFKGNCGSPMICEHRSQNFIVGIIVAGVVGDNIVAAEHVNGKVLVQAIESHVTPILKPTSGNLIEESPNLGDISKELQMPTRNCNSWWMESMEVGSIKTFGVLPVNISRPRSKVFNLPTFKFFAKYFPPEYHHSLIQPNFKSYRSESGHYYGVYRNMLDQVSKPAVNLNLKHLEACVKHLAEKFFRVDEFKEVEFWDIDHSCSGASYNDYCRPLPKHTSAGWPFSCKKIDLLVPSDSEYAPAGFVPNDELRSAIENVLSVYESGTRYDHVMKTCMKDEPRDRSKVAKRSIRVFTAAPVDMVIIQKMFFGSFSGIFIANFQMTETVAGLNCYSTQWGQVFHRLNRHPNAFDGDFSKYDKKSAAVALSGAYSVMVNVIRSVFNISLPQERIFSVIMTEIIYPILLMEQDLIGLNGSLSSGVWLTLILNNILNSLLIRMAWLGISEDKFVLVGSPSDASLAASLVDFERNVEFTALGDDNLYTVSDQAVEFFNFQSIQAYFNQVGYQYTNASKTVDPRGSTNISEVSIGKRKFVYDPEIDHYLCPIEKASIGKMLTIALNDGPLSDKEKVIASAQSAMYEFFQYGRDEYNLNIERLRCLMNDCDYSMNYYSYEEMHQRIIKNNETSWTSFIFDLIEDKTFTA